MTSPTPFEERQSDLNPHRDADRERASEVAYSQLRQRGVEIDGRRTATRSPTSCRRSSGSRPRSRSSAATGW
jgi:hypothetical protein